MRRGYSARGIEYKPSSTPTFTLLASFAIIFTRMRHATESSMHGHWSNDFDVGYVTPQLNPRTRKLP
jgi:hypothetical protein